MTAPFPASRDAFWLADTIQGYMAVWRGVLKKTGLLDLQQESYALTDQQGEQVSKTLAALAPSSQAQLLNMGGDLRPYVFWEKARQTYEPHPAMTAELMKLKGDTTVPAEVFKRLRHPNPWFLLPGDAPRITHADGRRGRLMSVLLCGALSPRYPYSGQRPIPGFLAPNASILTDTHDPDTNALHALVVSEVWTEDDSAIETYDMCHLTIPATGAFAVDDLVEQVAESGFAWAEDVRVAAASRERQRSYLETCARAAVSHLLYACSRTVELDDKPRALRPPAKRKPGTTPMPKSPRVLRMGWQTGAAIEDALRRPTSDRPAAGTGKSVRPHMRAAHLHLYRVGPGRQEVEMKWLDPIAVNARQDDGTTITNHPVR